MSDSTKQDTNWAGQNQAVGAAFFTALFTTLAFRQHGWTAGLGGAALFFALWYIVSLASMLIHGFTAAAAIFATHPLFGKGKR